MVCNYQSHFYFPTLKRSYQTLPHSSFSAKNLWSHTAIFLKTLHNINILKSSVSDAPTPYIQTEDYHRVRYISYTRMSQILRRRALWNSPLNRMFSSTNTVLALMFRLTLDGMAVREINLARRMREEVESRRSGGGYRINQDPFRARCR